MSTLIRAYLSSTKNVPAIFQKIREGTAPEKFTIAHLKGLGFKSSNDQPIIGILKALGFLADDGTPTQRYHDYRDPSKSKRVLGAALREAYADIFHINAKPTPTDRPAIEGKFVSSFNVKSELAARMAATFFSFLELSDLDSLPATPPADITQKNTPEQNDLKDSDAHRSSRSMGGLHYNIQIHLPATNEIEVYNAIFKAIKEHLVD